MKQMFQGILGICIITVTIELKDCPEFDHGCDTNCTASYDDDIKYCPCMESCSGMFSKSTDRNNMFCRWMSMFGI